MTGPSADAPPDVSLVAAQVDATIATSGVAAVEAGSALLDAIDSGSWRDVTLSGLGVGVEVVAAVLDPLGTLVAAGVGWLTEHVQPLSDLLDALAGDPGAVAAQARTWRNVARAVAGAADDLALATAPAPHWSGAAADAFARRGAARADDLRACALVADALAAAVDGAGTVVSLVRATVRELIAELVATLVARVPQWTLEEVGTLGIATPHVVAAATAVIAKVTRRVVRLVTGLVRSLRSLGDLVGEVLDLARRLLPDTPPRAPHVPAPTGAARATPEPRSPRGDAEPAGAPGPGMTPAPPTSPASRVPDPSPSPAASPPAPSASATAPGDAAGLGRIRSALEPAVPPPTGAPPTTPQRALGDGLPPVAPGTRTLVDQLPESRLTRGPEGLIERIDGRPHGAVVAGIGRSRADDLRAARDAGSLTAGRVGNVVTVALDRRTGAVVESTNGGRRALLPEAERHPVITEQLRDLEDGGPYPAFERNGERALDSEGRPAFREHPHPDEPLRHSEVKAVNQLLHLRGPSATSGVLPDFAVANHFPFDRRGVRVAPCCANCTAMLGEALSYSGKLSTFP